MKNILYLIVCTVIISCAPQNKYDKNTLNSNVNFEKLELLLSSDSLKVGNGWIFLNYSNIMKPLTDSLIVLTDKNKIIFLNGELEFLVELDESKYDFLIAKEIRDIESINNKIYLLDGIGSIVELTMEKYSIIDAKYLIKNQPSISDLSIINKDYMLVANMIIPPKYRGNSNLKLGSIINTIDGREESEFIITDKKLDRIWNNFIDKTFITTYHNKVYINFTISRSVFVYNIYDGQLITKYEAEVNKSVWQEPTISSYTSEESVNGEAQFQNSSLIIPVFNDSIQKVDSNYFQIVFNGMQDTMTLYLYNAKFIFYKKYNLDVLESDVNYKLYFYGDKCLIIGKKLYLFEL